MRRELPEPVEVEYRRRKQPAPVWALIKWALVALSLFLVWVTMSTANPARDCIASCAVVFAVLAVLAKLENRD